MYDQIRKLCEENKISIQQLSRDIEVSKNTIGRWDTNSPSIDKVVKVADYFNVSLDYLCGRTNKKSPPPEDGELVELDLTDAELDIISALREHGDDPVFLAALQGVISAFANRSADQAATNA